LSQSELHHPTRTRTQFARNYRTFQQRFSAGIFDFSQGIKRGRNPNNLVLIKRADLDFATAAGTFHEPHFDPLIEKESQNEIRVSFDHFTFYRGVLGLEPKLEFDRTSAVAEIRF
jgi:hypothetical protein